MDFYLRIRKQKDNIKIPHELYVLTKILVSTKLPDPINDTGIPKLGFMIIPCLKLRTQYFTLLTLYSIPARTVVTLE